MIPMHIFIHALRVLLNTEPENSFICEHLNGGKKRRKTYFWNETQKNL